MALGAAEAPSRFHASWFAFTMGTGGLGIALSRVPWATHTFTRIGLGLWLGNAAVFAVLTVGFFFRLASLRAALRIEEALFLGAFAVTFVTLSTGTSTFGVAMGANERSSIASHVIWLASASMCAIVSSALPVARVLSTAPPEQSPVSITTVSPTWILAFAPVLVSALAGGVVLQGPTLLNTPAVAASLLLAFMLFAVGVFFTHSLMLLYFLQLVYQQYSPGIAVYWICVAPPSVTGSSAIALAHALEQLSERLQLPPSLQAFQSFSKGLAVVVALGCWSIAVWWLLLALGISVNSFLRRGFPPWTPSLWAFVFPLSAFAQLCSVLSPETGIIALQHLCGVLTLSTLVVWVLLLLRLIATYMYE